MCSVNGYFPHITLSFIHQSVQLTALTSKEWTNADGTKGMSVTVKASPSPDPYICVASDVPGSNDSEEWSTVFFLQLEEKEVFRTQKSTSYLDGYVITSFISE